MVTPRSSGTIGAMCSEIGPSSARSAGFFAPEKLRVERALRDALEDRKAFPERAVVERRPLEGRGVQS